VATLKPTYKIGLLSNVSTNWISEQLLTPEEMALFDDVVLSYKVGMTKPDPRIYKLAAEHLKVSETECLMVDDSENNCEGARAVGMQSICYQDFVQFKSELETLLR
jgi:putative hydrolase of the HAD superfamily